MRLNIKHHGRGVFRITGMRAIIKGQCESVNLSVRLAEPSPIPASYCDIALNSILMPSIVDALEKMEYTPGTAGCVDCGDCIQNCSLKERNVNETD